MKIQGLDGRFYVLDVRQDQHPLRSEKASKSKLQYACGQLLRKKFPSDIILEELSLPGSKGLYLDFLIPTKRMAFEIQGRQHNEFVPFFHGTEKKFRESMGRDERKQEWCDLNGIDLYCVDSEKDMVQLLSS